MEQALIDRYERSLAQYASRLLGDPELARDVVQECFLRLVRERPSGSEHELRSWLFTVVRNLAFDQLRTRRRMTYEGNGESAELELAPSPDDLFEAREEQSRTLALLATLPKNQQEVLRLKFQGGLSYREISEVTKLSTSNVGYLIHVGLKALRAKLEADKVHAIVEGRSQ